MVRSTFKALVFVCCAISFVSAARAEDRVVREYWDDAKTQPKNIQIYDARDRQTGEWITWFKSGKMKSKVSFRHGEILLCEAWYENGEKRYQQPLADGLAHGLWTYWGPDGEVLAKSYFVMGTGLEYHFDDDGKEKRRRFWVSGVLEREETTEKGMQGPVEK